MNIFILALLSLFATSTDRCLHTSCHAMGDWQLHSPYSHTETKPSLLQHFSYKHKQMSQKSKKMVCYLKTLLFNFIDFKGLD